ncbi:MAG: transporter substrate-binding domain-containing protein [Opitutales bacterium]
MRQPPFVFLLLLLSGSLGLAAKPLRVGVENNSPPLSYLDAAGRPIGFDHDLLEAMRSAGLSDLEVVPDYWSKILREFQEGKIDALMNVTITPERRATMDFSIKHAYGHALVYYAKGRPPLRQTSDFVGKSIGVLVGTTAYLNAVASQGWGAKVVPYDDWKKELEDVRLGRIDAALFVRRPSTILPTKAASGLTVGFVDDIVYEYHFAVRKGDAATLERLNEALAKVRSDGTFDRIYARWIGPLEPHPIHWADLRPYYLPGTLIVLAVVVLFGWQRHMVSRLARQAAELKESEARWKFALEGSGDGVWDWDIPGNVVLRSRRWKEMLGYSETEIGLGLGEWTSRVHPEDREAAAKVQERERRGDETFYAVEHRMRCKNGTWKWILNRGMVVRRDAGGQPLRMIGTHTDLTARKQAEEDRLILGKLESTGVLAGGIAHDFNNLLTAILLNLDLARYHRNSAEEMLPRVEAAEKATLAARSLTQQLITFARGGASVVRVTDVGHLLLDSMPLVLSGSNVRAAIDISPDLWPAEVDGGQIGQVIRNLVLNAREAMPHGGVVTLQAGNVTLGAGEVGGLPPGDYLHICVVDQGEGVAPELQARIFDPYFSTKQRSSQKGMGLGLTICHSVVHRHKGAITLESIVGRGTTFHVYLPAAVSAPPPRGESTPPLPGRATTPRRILVMDDEPIMRETMEQTLRHWGHEVAGVENGKAAIELYRQAKADGRPFDLAILDLTIPGGMGGRETLAGLQVVDAEVTAVVMSGYTNEDVMSEFAAAGFKAALAKPFASDRLRAVLAELNLA